MQIEETAIEKTFSLIERLPEPMREALGFEVLGSSLLRWTAALAVFLLTLLVLRLLRWVVHRRLRRLDEKTDAEAVDLFIRLTDRTRTLVLFILAAFMASRALVLAGAVDVALERLLFIAVVVQIGLWSNDLLDFALRRYVRRHGDEEAPGQVAILSLVNFFGQVAIWSVALLLVLDNLGVDVTTLIAGLGVGGVAVGLALQNVLKDTFASLSIALDKPFETGDFIILGSEMGTVERVGIKTTRIRSLSGEQLVIGNGDLLSSRIRNFKRMEERRVVFVFRLVYQTPAEKLARVPEIVREIIEATADVRFDRAHFKEYGEWGLIFEVVYYVLSPEYTLYMDRQQEINLEIYRRLEAEGVAFAFPTQVVHLAGKAKEAATDEE